MVSQYTKTLKVTKGSAQKYLIYASIPLKSFRFKCFFGQKRYKSWEGR